MATVPSCVVPPAHGVALAQSVPASLLPYVQGHLPGDNFLSDFCRFCWDIQGVPGADTVRKYMGQVVKFCERHLGIRMTPPAVLCDALKRQSQAPTDRPVRQPCPVELIAAVIFSKHASLGVQLALVLLWFGGFRAGELLSAKVLDFDEHFGLRRCDCKVAPDLSSLSLYFRKAKADVKNKGGVRYIKAAPPGAAVCPVQFVARYLRATSDTPELYPLVMHPRDGAGPRRCVTRSHVTAAIKSAAEALGISTVGLGCHSVRTGHATALLASPSVTATDRQLSGGWVSELGPLPYHRVCGPFLDRLAGALAIDDQAVLVGTGAEPGWSSGGRFGGLDLDLRVSSPGAPDTL